MSYIFLFIFHTRIFMHLYSILNVMITEYWVLANKNTSFWKQKSWWSHQMVLAKIGWIDSVPTVKGCEVLDRELTHE